MVSALGFASFCCVYVELRWWECAALVCRSLPVNWAITTIGLTPVHCIPMAIGFPSVRHVLTAIGVFPIHCEVGALILFVVFFLLVDVKPLSH